jgi:hypothetical protein
LRLAAESRDEPLAIEGSMKPDDVASEAPAEFAERALGDLRFRALLSEEDWTALPTAIRRRFSRRLSDGNTSVYSGLVLETWMSRAGWLLAQMARLIGGPLPTATDADVPSVVTVTEDFSTGGQIWTRLYARRRGFPQIIHSSKRFAGPTGLEEYVGFGVGMALRVGVRDRALVFRSDRYFLQVLGRRIFLPAWASPGDMTITHAELGKGRFVFTLEVVHRRIGPLIRQTGVFEEVTQ